MAETGGTKPTETTTWAEGVGAIIEVADAGRKAQGHILYLPKVGVFNWFWQLVARITAWGWATQIREFDHLSEGCAAMPTSADYGALFRVRSADAATIRDIGVVVWNITPFTPAGSVVVGITIPADGERVFINEQTTDTVMAVNTVDGSIDWTAAVAGQPAQGMGCDGNEVAYLDNALDNIEWRQASDGVLAASVAVGFNLTNTTTVIVQHGQYTFAFITNLAGPTDMLRLYKGHALTWTVSPLTWAPTGIAECLPKVADERLILICGGNGNSADNIEAFEIETGAARWTWNFPGIITEDVHDVCCDGHYVFVVHDNTGANSITALDVYGNVLWTAETNSTNSVLACCVDHRWLYVADEDAILSAIDKATGVEVWDVDLSAVGASIVSLTADGHSVYAAFPGATERLARISVNAIGTEFVRVDESMDFRRPVVTKALPIKGI